ncbi:hypothetical protein MJL77_23640 [Salmonella enterica subsp. enterica serovar Anatum]|nr:hypothetical protein [Salmonella enterica subsp. enterica serovar Anatum]
MGGTRLIYDGSKKESSINVSNPQSGQPGLTRRLLLVQSAR